jgi:hypothetical protein
VAIAGAETKGTDLSKPGDYRPVSLHCDSTDNVLVSGTLGRGTRTVSDFTNTLPHARR